MLLYFICQKNSRARKITWMVCFLIEDHVIFFRDLFFLIQLRQTVNANTRDWKFERIFKDIINWSVINKAQKIVKASKTYYNTIQCDLQVRNIARNCSDYKPLKLIAIQFTFSAIRQPFWILLFQIAIIGCSVRN